jgi:hypothetical protein
MTELVKLALAFACGVVTLILGVLLGRKVVKIIKSRREQA